MNHTSPDNPARYPSLVGKTVLITGGGSGIGGAMSVLFASQDCSVVVLDIDDAASRSLVDGLCDDGRRVAYFHCAVTDIEALQRTISTVESAHAAVDVLVNNAARDDRQDPADRQRRVLGSRDRRPRASSRVRRAGRRAGHAAKRRRIDHQHGVGVVDARPPGDGGILDVEGGDPWPDAHARARAGRDEHPRQLARSGCDADRAPA